MQAEQKPTIKTHRELITELLGRLHPESDLSDEETLFAIIYADYEAYAQVLDNRDAELTQAAAEGEIRGRNARIDQLINAQAPSDGIPALGGANTACSSRPASIFDMARGI